jgi:uncharacterized repeat protein (TIGR02543 family)
MDQQNTPKDFPEERKLRGLYRHVKISVKTLDRIILVGIAAIVLVLIFAVGHSGYTVTFDSKGGTDVAAQELRYGDVIQEPQAPTREGYVFDGWYADESLGSLWDFETPIESSMTLYAGWTQNP